MDTVIMKEYLLKNSFGGVMYDITEGSEMRMLVEDNVMTSRQLMKNIDDTPETDGIDKGISNYIKEVLGVTA